MNVNGHIKLDRKILSWEWYDDANTFRVFIHLLLMATHKDGRYRGFEIKRGEVVTGRLKLASALRLSEMEIRTCLNKLKSTNEITTRTTNKFSIISICKYDIYQSFRNENNQQDNQQSNQQPTNNKPTINQQSTTFKNVNNDKNVISNNYINNSEGGFATPSGIPADVVLPDKNYYASDFNGLPNENNESIRTFLKVTKKIEVQESEVCELWSIFKIQELTGVKLYRNKEDVYRHFLNWSKKQTFRNTTRTPRLKKESKDARGVEFINDFTECKMSDGTTKKLTINQQDSARYNQINANSIVK